MLKLNKICWTVIKKLGNRFFMVQIPIVVALDTTRRNTILIKERKAFFQDYIKGDSYGKQVVRE